MNRKLILLSFALLVFFSSFLFASEESSGFISVMITEQKKAERLNKSFLDIINSSIELELKIKQFASYRKDVDTLPGLYEKALKENTSYIILTEVQIDAEELKYIMAVYRAADQFPVYETSRTVTINFYLDQAVKESASILVQAMIADSLANPDKIVRKSPEVLPVGEAAGESPVSFFSLSLGFGPYLTNGEASSYFTTGLAPEFHADFNFKTPGGYWSLGIFGSYNLAEARGVLFDADLQFASVGPELQYAIRFNPVLDLFYNITGGYTILIVNPNDEGIRIASFPFASGRVGLNINIFKHAGLYLSAGYLVYFEQSVVITGLLPSLGLHLRF